MQLSSSYHELFELHPETDLWVLTVYAQKVMLGQESSRCRTDVMRFQIVLDVEKSRNDKLVSVHALDRANTLHAEVTV